MSIEFADVAMTSFPSSFDKEDAVSFPVRQAALRYAVALSNMGRNAIDLNLSLIRESILQDSRLTIGELEQMLQDASTNSVEIVPIQVDLLPRVMRQLKAYNFTRQGCKNLKRTLEHWADANTPIIITPNPVQFPQRERIILRRVPPVNNENEAPLEHDPNVD